MPGKRLDELALSIDKGIGARIRQRRMEMRMSQGKVGALIGVTFQQIQKFENATNRISASALARIAEGLDATPAFFFDRPETADPDVIERFAAIPGASDIAQAYLAMPPDARVIYEKTGELLANIPWQRD